MVPFGEKLGIKGITVYQSEQIVFVMEENKANVMWLVVKVAVVTQSLLCPSAWS